MSRLAEVLADLRAEGDQLDALVAGLPDDGTGWRAPTPAAGWDVAHQVAHLAWTDEAAALAADAAAADADASRDAGGVTRGWDALVRSALEDVEGFVDAAAARGAAVPAPELLERWRTSRGRLAESLRELPEGVRLPWFGPPMSVTSMATARFMETWAHARDVAEAVGSRLPQDDRVRHVVHLGVRTRDFAFRNRGLQPPVEQFRVELTLPGGDVVATGPVDAAQTVTGAAYDFALVVTQRMPRGEADLVATGPDADRWLDVAQAFAGPPGPGRGPR